MEYWATLALRSCPGLGARTLAKLLKHFGSARKACTLSDQWLAIGIPKRCLDSFRSEAWVAAATSEWQSAEKSDAAILLWEADIYPPLLRQIVDPPALLYCRGDLTLLRGPCIAIVGSRLPEARGQQLAGIFGNSLSRAGICVVSGMAQGIDRAAHAGALAGPGSSIGVLGTGIEIEYPRMNSDIFGKMRGSGLLISEFAPEAPPVGSNFPIRNRIISGLSLGVVVVEAAVKSGSLITARTALEQNRSVFAVPGSPLDTSSVGCNNLVRQGATSVFTTDDILRDLAAELRAYGVKTSPGLTPSPAPASPKAEPESPRLETAAKVPMPEPPPPVSREQEESARGLAGDDVSRLILTCLGNEGVLHGDQLLELTGLSHSQLSAALIGLEMLGQIRLLPGSRYEVLS